MKDKLTLSGGGLAIPQSAASTQMQREAAHIEQQMRGGFWAGSFFAALQRTPGVEPKERTAHAAECADLAVKLHEERFPGAFSPILA